MPSSPALPRSRPGARRAFTLVEVLLVTLVVAVIAAIALFAVGGAHREGEQAVVAGDLQTLQVAQEHYHQLAGRYATDPLAQLSGFRPGARTQLLATVAGPTRWATVATSPLMTGVCSAVGGYGRGRAHAMCATRPTVPVAVSNANPAVGETITLDATAALSRLAAGPDVGGAGGLLWGETIEHTGARPVLVAWDFGDGSGSMGGDPSSYGRVDHRVTRPGTARRPIKVAIVDGLGQLYLGQVAAGAVGSGPLPPAVPITPRTPNVAPVAAIDLSPASSAVGSPVTFSGARSTDADGRVISYRWSLDGTVIDSGRTASRTFTAAQQGSHTVSLQVTDDAGASASAAATLVIGGANRAPVAQIARGDRAVSVRRLITFSALPGSTDPDGSISGYTWDLGDGSPAVSGASVSRRYGTPGLYRVRLVVTDNGGLSAQDEITISAVNNVLPVARASVSPSTAPTGTPFTFDGSGSTDADGTVAAWSWTLPGYATPLAGRTASGAIATPGVYWVRLTATDDLEDSADDSVRVTVTNRPPVAGSIACTPANAMSLSAVTCTVSGWSDPDGGTPSFSWALGPDWTGTTTGPSVSGQWATAGAHTLTVTARDGQTGAPNGEGVTTSSLPFTVGNRLPGSGSFVCVPSTPSSLTPVACTAAGWVDPDGSATAMTYSVNYGDAGVRSGTLTSAAYATPGPRTIVLTITDAAGGTVTQTAAVVVQNLAPTKPVATCTPLDPASGSTVTCTLTSPSVDADGGTLTYSWSPSARVGASTGTSSTYRSSTPGTVPVIVTASDGQGGATASDAVSVGFANQDPLAPLVSCTPTGGPTGTAMTCTASGATDPDGGALRYRLLVSGAGLSANDSSASGVSSFARTWSPGTPGTMTVTPAVRDDQGSGWVLGTALSLSVTNRAPTAPGITCSPSSPVGLGTVVTCSLSTPATDPDGGTLSYTWSAAQRTGAATGTSTTYAASTATTTSVTVVATDGQGGSTSSSAVTLTWANLPPSRTGTAGCTPATAVTGSTVTCTDPWTDPDGGTLNWFWGVWDPTGATNYGGTFRSATSTLLVTPAVLNRPGSYGVWSTVQDGQGFNTGTDPWSGSWSGWTRIGTFTLTNRGPSTPAITCTPTTTTSLSAVTCSVSTAATDPDGGTITYTWSAGGRTGAATGTSTTYTLSGPGSLSVNTVASDGQGGSATSNTVALTFTNRAPSAASLSCSPTTTSSTQPVTCTASGGSDADGGALQYAINVSGPGVGEVTINSQFSAWGASSWTQAYRPARPGTWTFIPYVQDSQGSGWVRGTPVTVTITNVAPSAPAISCTPSTTTRGQTVTCTASGSGDVDGGSLQYAINVTGPGVGEMTINSQFSARGAGSWTQGYVVSAVGTWTFIPYVNDDQGSGWIRGTPVTITVVNQNPYRTGAGGCSPATAYPGTAVVCTDYWTDPDGGTLSYYWGVYDPNGSVNYGGWPVASSGYYVASPNVVTAPGAYGVWSTASDDQGSGWQWGSWIRIGTFTILSPNPTTGSMYCTPDSTTPGSVFSCYVSGTNWGNGGGNYYAWNVYNPSGTLVLSSNTGSSYGWSAPATAGTYRVAVTAYNSNWYVGDEVSTYVTVVPACTRGREWDGYQCSCPSGSYWTGTLCKYYAVQ